jgi:C4-dicarboxylate transporter DctQ subunit
MKIWHLIDNCFEETLITLLMGYFVLATILQVIFRLILNIPGAWTEETARYAFIWMTFIGSAVAVKRNNHVRVDVLEKNIFHNVAVARYVYWLSMAFFFVFCMTIAVIGIQMCLSAIRRPQMSPVLNISMFWVHLSLPLGMILSILRMVQKFWRKFISQKHDMPFPLGEEGTP